MMNSEEEFNAQKSKIERKQKLHKIRILHSLMLEGEKKIEEVLSRTKITTEPQSLIITGEAGTGKTILFSYFIKKNDLVYHKETFNGMILTRKILSLRLPYPATIQGTIAQMLIALGDKFPDSVKSTEGKTRRLVQLIQKCGVELIMIDEFQNMVDKDKQKTLRGAAEWIKNLINDTKLPFVFFGTPKSVDILDANEGQLQRRVENFHVMKRYGYWSMDEQKNFSNLLEKIDKLLPFPERSSLESHELSIRIFNATGGLMHSIMSLITRAAELAIEDDSEFIKLYHFEKAYLMNGYLSGKQYINPFKLDFLDQISTKKQA